MTTKSDNAKLYAYRNVLSNLEAELTNLFGNPFNPTHAADAARIRARELLLEDKGKLGVRFPNVHKI